MEIARMDYRFTLVLFVLLALLTWLVAPVGI
jgi:hypothetical protein